MHNAKAWKCVRNDWSTVVTSEEAALHYKTTGHVVIPLYDKILPDTPSPHLIEQMNKLIQQYGSISNNEISYEIYKIILASINTLN